VQRVKRRYKIDVEHSKKLLPGEVEGVKDMVVVLKVAGYNRIQISKVIGISRQQVADFLAESDVADRIITLRDRIPAAAVELMQGFMVEAVMAIVDVMRATSDDALVLKAAGDILDRGGAPKQSRKENINETYEQHTVSMDTDFMELIRTAPPEVQEQAAQMIEGLENLLKETVMETESEDETPE
jgi:hypothetical protein